MVQNYITIGKPVGNTKLYILDPESEYKTMCKAIGGNWIDCSGGTGKNVGRINPLQVNKLPTNIEDEDEDSTIEFIRNEIWQCLIYIFSIFPLIYFKFKSGNENSYYELETIKCCSFILMKLILFIQNLFQDFLL